MVSAKESPVHDNYKQLVVEADATDSVLLSPHRSPAYRVMRTELSESLEREETVVLGHTVGIDDVLRLYFEGDLSSGFAFGGQGAGRIGEVVPVAEIIHATVSEFYETVTALERFLPSPGSASEQ